MSKISIFNYEGYYLELIEGTISIENKALLLDFLAKNPNLVEPEFEYALPKVDFDTPNQFKESLKIHNETEIISEKNIEWFVWAKTEGVLSAHSTARLKRFLDNQPEFYRLVVDFQEAKLPTETVSFHDKKSLKKKQKISIWWAVSTVAATILALVLVGEIFTQKTPPSISLDSPSSEIKAEEKKDKTANLSASLSETNNEISKVAPKKKPTAIIRHNNKEAKVTFSLEKDSTVLVQPETKEKPLETTELAITEPVVTQEEELQKEEITNAPKEEIISNPTEEKEEITTQQTKRKFKLRIGRFGVTRK